MLPVSKWTFPENEIPHPFLHSFNISMIFLYNHALMTAISQGKTDYIPATTLSDNIVKEALPTQF